MFHFTIYNEKTNIRQFFQFFNWYLWIFQFLLIQKVYRQFFNLCGMPHMADRVKIKVLQKGLHMRGHFFHFFLKGGQNRYFCKLMW